MISMPRWWKDTLSKYLAELDYEFEQRERSGPVTLEIHYRSGAPMLAKVRTQPLPPPIAEFKIGLPTDGGFHALTSSTS